MSVAASFGVWLRCPDPLQRPCARVLERMVPLSRTGALNRVERRAGYPVATSASEAAAQAIADALVALDPSQVEARLASPPGVSPWDVASRV